MDLYEKLLEVSRLFRIEYEYLGYETIQMGNVNKTYKVNFLLPGGVPKSFLVQNVNTYAFRQPVGLMQNIDLVTEHIRGKKPGQKKGGMKAMGFEINADMMSMMNGFTVLRLITLMGGMMDVKMTKEQLLGINAQLNMIPKPQETK